MLQHILALVKKLKTKHAIILMKFKHILLVKDSNKMSDYSKKTIDIYSDSNYKDSKTIIGWIDPYKASELKTENIPYIDLYENTTNLNSKLDVNLKINSQKTTEPYYLGGCV